MGANASGDDFEANDKEVFQSYRIPPKAYKKKTKDTSSASDTSLKCIPGSPTSLEFNRILSSSSSSSSLNLSIVNAAVAAGTPSLYDYSNNGYARQMNSAPLPMMVNASTVGSRTNSGYSIGSDSLDLSHNVGSGLGRATYVNGKMVEMGIHGNGYLPQGSSKELYMHSNYTVQDFMSYQQQQQQQFLEQQQYEYQQMLLLQQQQQQLKKQYQQQQMLLLQQQQKLQSGQIAVPGARPSQDATSQSQITGVVLQTKTRRPARHPDRVTSSIGHRSNVSQSITIPSSNNNGSNQSLQRQGHVSSSPSSPRVALSHRSPTLSNAQAIHFGSSPPGSMASSYTTNEASSFSSTGSHFQTMLAMTSASPPSSSSSSLSNVENNQSNTHYRNLHQQHPWPTPSSAAVASGSGGGGGGGQTKGTMNKSGLSIEEIAAKILPPRRVLGGREYYPDKTLPYLLPCDEQEGERLLLQHYVTRYAFGSNIIPPIDTSIAGKVLDCGCGPGTWIMEMATEFEDLDFYGFDVSPMYPSAIHPKNAHFSMANLLDPEIPFATDSYLLVHQRNMLLGLTQDAWPGIVQDLFRCVIPGGSGWLQLSESRSPSVIPWRPVNARRPMHSRSLKSCSRLVASCRSGNVPRTILLRAGCSTRATGSPASLSADYELMQSEAWTSELIQQNPCLEKLSWKGGDFHRDDYSKLDYATLVRLHQLRALKLDCWTISDAGQFLEILENNQSTLRFLALGFCKGGISLAAKSAMSTITSSLRSLELRSPPPSYKSFTDVSPPMLQLIYLTKLNICKDVDSGPMEDLIRLCPNLLSLSWTGPNDQDLKSLIRNLKMSPSKVLNLTYSVIELTEPESVYAELIRCFCGLTELQIKMPALSIPHLMYGFTATASIATENAPLIVRTPERRMTIDGSSANSDDAPQVVGFTEALLGHASSLQILDLQIMRPKTVESSNVHRILTSCRDLRVLSIVGSNCKALDLCKIQSPWRCMRLQRLNLSGLHITTKGFANEVDNSQVARQYGWRGEGDDVGQDSAERRGDGEGGGDGSDTDEEMILLQVPKLNLTAIKSPSLLLRRSSQINNQQFWSPLVELIHSSPNLRIVEIDYLDCTVINLDPFFKAIQSHAVLQGLKIEDMTTLYSLHGVLFPLLVASARLEKVHISCNSYSYVGHDF
ncbi:hypothetical protein BGZ52_009005 [Haplosporangium bisporale]|nr:hypothetical protein BGZ52_009005 [Haplosporangium bisporale]